MHKLIIAGKTIQDNGNAYVIAEIGHNHQGDLEIAKKMFRIAKECGADAVKLQKRNNRKLYTKAAYGRLYDNRNSYGTTYGEHREALEFDKIVGRTTICALKADENLTFEVLNGATI